MERNVKIDAIRGLAIVLMILGHCIQFGQGKAYLDSYAYFDDVIFKSIYSFHMPLFAAISGYLIFIQLSRYNSFSQYVKRQIGSLIVPVFIWSFIVNFILTIFVTH